MFYLSVGDRCGVDIESLDLGVTKEVVLEILEGKGFSVIDFDMVSASLNLVGRARYKRAAVIGDAPGVLDCSLLSKWLYGQMGIWLPRRSVQQRDCGVRVDKSSDFRVGDLLFTKGCISYYLKDQSDSVGHVGVYIGDGCVVEAKNTQVGVVLTDKESFQSYGFRGATRIVPDIEKITVLKTPTHRNIECADDIAWIVRQSL